MIAIIIPNLLFVNDKITSKICNTNADLRSIKAIYVNIDSWPLAVAKRKHIAFSNDIVAFCIDMTYAVCSVCHTGLDISLALISFYACRKNIIYNLRLVHCLADHFPYRSVLLNTFYLSGALRNPHDDRSIRNNLNISIND